MSLPHRICGVERFCAAHFPSYFASSSFFPYVLLISFSHSSAFFSSLFFSQRIFFCPHFLHFILLFLFPRSASYFSLSSHRLILLFSFSHHLIDGREGRRTSKDSPSHFNDSHRINSITLNKIRRCSRFRNPYWSRWVNGSKDMDFFLIIGVCWFTSSPIVISLSDEWSADRLFQTNSGLPAHQIGFCLQTCFKRLANRCDYGPDAWISSHSWVTHISAGRRRFIAIGWV